MQELLQVFLLSTAPIGELRASIPIGIGVYHLNWFYVYIVSVLGNLVPVLFLLFFLEPVSKVLRKNKELDRFFIWLFKRTRKKVETKVNKHGALALLLFVAIPLPVTGAWTGSVIAFLYKIPKKKAFLMISLGVLLAGVIVTFLTFLGVNLSKYLGFESLIFIAVVVTLFFILKKCL